MEYLRLDPDIDSDPGLEEAGWCATRVYELLLKVSARYDLRGRIPAERQSSSWLAKRWNLSPDDLPGVKPEDFIANGIARLLDVGKLVQDGDAWVIRGWDKAYRPNKTPAERKADERARKEATKAEPQPDVTNVTSARDSHAACDMSHESRDSHVARDSHATHARTHAPTNARTHEQAAREFVAWANEVNPDLYRQLPEPGEARAWYEKAISEVEARGLDDDALRASYRQWLAEPFVQGLSPPGRWSVWVKQWGRHLPSPTAPKKKPPLKVKPYSEEGNRGAA